MEPAKRRVVALFYLFFFYFFYILFKCRRRRWSGAFIDSARRWAMAVSCLPPTGNLKRNVTEGKSRQQQKKTNTKSHGKFTWWIHAPLASVSSSCTDVFFIDYICLDGDRRRSAKILSLTFVFSNDLRLSLSSRTSFMSYLLDFCSCLPSFRRHRFSARFCRFF